MTSTAWPSRPSTSTSLTSAATAPSRNFARTNASGKKDFLYRSDREELEKYAAALNDPRNTEMRGVETVTNKQESVQYWRIMMAAYGVKGHARYVP